MSAFFCVVLSCVGSGLSNVQIQIHKFQKSNSESEQARGSNPSLLLSIFQFVQLPSSNGLLSQLFQDVPDVPLLLMNADRSPKRMGVHHCWVRHALSVK
jgi:hypothetical protein